MKKTFLMCLVLSFSLFFTGCGGKQTTNIQIPGVSGPKVTLQSENIVIDMVFEKILMEGTLHYAIPKLENSYVDLAVDPATGGAHLAFIININGLLKGYGSQVDPLKLPGGRLLPGVLSGSLPAVAFTIEKFKNVTFYIGKTVFGFFVPFDSGIDNSIVTFRYYVGTTRGGNISLVGRDPQGENSGLLLLLDMTNQAKNQLQKYLSKL